MQRLRDDIETFFYVWPVGAANKENWKFEGEFVDQWNSVTG